MIPATAYLEVLGWLAAYLLLVWGYGLAARGARPVSVGEQGERLGRFGRGRVSRLRGQRER